MPGPPALPSPILRGDWSNGYDAGLQNPRLGFDSLVPRYERPRARLLSSSRGALYRLCDPAPVAAVALGAYLLYLALAFGWRTVLQLRRTGSSGFKGVSGQTGSAEWFAGVLFVIALAVGAAAPVLALIDVVEAFAALDRTAADLTRPDADGPERRGTRRPRRTGGCPRAAGARGRGALPPARTGVRLRRLREPGGTLCTRSRAAGRKRTRTLLDWAARGRGETGRHAAFRWRCSKELGGSSPSARMTAAVAGGQCAARRRPRN